MEENESINPRNQLWFWDQQFLRNKADPTRVLGINSIDDKRFGRLKSFATVTNAGANLPTVPELQFQPEKLHFEIQAGELKCKWEDLRVSYNESNQVVGCTDRDDSNPQKWEILYGKAMNS